MVTWVTKKQPTSATFHQCPDQLFQPWIHDVVFTAYKRKAAKQQRCEPHEGRRKKNNQTTKEGGESLSKSKAFQKKHHNNISCNILFVLLLVGCSLLVGSISLHHHGRAINHDFGGVGLGGETTQGIPWNWLFLMTASLVYP